MSELDLKAIKARLGAATRGPWHPYNRGIGWEVHHGPIQGRCTPRPERGDDCLDEINSEFRGTFGEGDAKFIAHAPTDIASLVAEVERLRALIDERMPCNGACSPDRPDFECPLHGMSPKAVWEIVGEHVARSYDLEYAAEHNQELRSALDSMPKTYAYWVGLRKIIEDAMDMYREARVEEARSRNESA